MDESLSSEHLADIAAGRDKQSGSLGELFRSYWRPLLLCFLFTLGGTVAFYTYSVNAPAMVRSNLPKDPQLATWINLGSLLVLMLLQPLGGLLSDKIGRKPLLVFFGIGGVAWSYYLITHLAGQKDPWVMVGMLLLSFVILTGYTSINAIVKAELFPAHIRALGLGLGYGLANSIFGGTSPMIYAAAKQNKAVPQFAIYVTVCIAISLICYSVFLKNKAETHLDREQGHAYQK